MGISCNAAQIEKMQQSFPALALCGSVTGVARGEIFGPVDAKSNLATV
jgi:hypothetical protein